MTTILNILGYVSILALVALGLAIVFGMMDIVNLAHAEWVTIGAYTLAVVQAVAGKEAFWVALLAAPLTGALLGWCPSVSSSGFSTTGHWIPFSRPTRSA